MQPAFHQQNYKECIWSNRRLKIPITIVGTEIGICVSCLLPPPHTLLILHSQMTPPTSSQLSSLSVSSLLFRFQLILLFLFLSLSFLTEPRVPGHLCRKTVNSEGLGMESPQGRTCKQRERKTLIMIITTIYRVCHVWDTVKSSLLCHLIVSIPHPVWQALFLPC